MNTENQKADNIKSGYIYILYNEVYTYYGENVFKIGKSRVPNGYLICYQKKSLNS